MFIHLETEQVQLHMSVEECFFNNHDRVEIYIYGFIHIEVFIDEVQYLSCFDEGKCVLLIKHGEILKEQIE